MRGLRLEPSGASVLCGPGFPERQRSQERKERLQGHPFSRPLAPDPPSLIAADALAPGSRLSTAARVAGVVIAAGYLLGLTPGPLVSVIGALALVTYGRLLIAERPEAIRNGIALAIVAAALGVGALRWGTLDLGELRGVQSVLGPSLLVGPPLAAIACGAAAIAALLALGSWLNDPRPTDRTSYVWAATEALVWSLAVVTVLFDPARSALGGAGFASAALDLGRWILATVVATAMAVGVASLEARLTGRLRWLVLGVAAALVAIAAALVASIL